MKKKHPFVLLELMIAFALVSLSTLPFIRHPLQHLKGEVSELYVMEIEREIDKQLAKIHIELLTNPKEILEEKKIVQELSLPIRLDKTLERSFKGKITLRRSGYKTDKDSAKCALIAAKVEVFGPHKRPMITRRTFFIMAEEK